MNLSDVCLTSISLSVAYIEPKSRIERPGKTKIGTVTRAPFSKSKSQRSRSQGAGEYCGDHPHSLFSYGAMTGEWEIFIPHLTVQ